MSGDRARVSVSVAVEPVVAFRIFTGDIDRWWRRGVKFRHSSSGDGSLRLEPKLGGRLFETYVAEGVDRVIEVGHVLLWDPPLRIRFTWRNVNFAPHERTQVEVEFIPQSAGTLVVVTHHGLATLPADHPARHGLVGAEFARMIGLWWGEQMSSFRLHCIV